MIKDLVINKELEFVKANSKDIYDDTKISEIKYGLEAVYLTVTKIFFILIIAIFLKLLKEVLLVILFFNVLRATGFGLHAPKSWICWVLSITFFIGGTYICKFFIFDKFFLIMLSIFCLISLGLFAPADTKKRPIIQKKKRILFKLLTVIFTLIYIVVIFLSHNNLINNILTFSILLETILVIPFSYKLLKLPYNNFKNYH